MPFWLNYNSDHIGKKVILAVISGICLTLAFPSTGFWPIAWFSPAMLLFLLAGLTPFRAFYCGFIFGVAHFSTLLYWLCPTVHNYGPLSWPLAIAVFMLLVVYLAFFPALFCLGVSMTSRQPAGLILNVPIFWVGAEYLRGHMFTGFPWGLVGYSQYPLLTLVQLADVFGVMGVSFLVLLGNSAFFLLAARFFMLKWHGVTVNRGVALGALACFLAVMITAFFYGEARLGWLEKNMNESRSMKVAVIQGNIPQSLKWDVDEAQRTIEKYLELSKAVARKSDPPDLIVWPETAAPFYFGLDYDFTKRVLKAVDDTGIPFIIGAPAAHATGSSGGWKIYNSAFLLIPGKGIAGRYDKVHLVPFGEYIPKRDWFPFLGKIVAQELDFSPGDSGNILKLENTKIGMLICYEAIFPELSVDMVSSGAGLLINLTNDAWFMKTSAPYQHFEEAAFRAIEVRRPLIRAANTGISGAVDYTGKVVAQSSLFRTQTLLLRVYPGNKSDSLYLVMGDTWALVCSVLLIITLLSGYIRYNRKKFILSRNFPGICKKDSKN